MMSLYTLTSPEGGNTNCHVKTAGRGTSDGLAPVLFKTTATLGILAAIAGARRGSKANKRRGGKGLVGGSRGALSGFGGGLGLPLGVAAGGLIGIASGAGLGALSGDPRTAGNLVLGLGALGSGVGGYLGARGGYKKGRNVGLKLIGPDELDDEERVLEDLRALKRKERDKGTNKTSALRDYKSTLYGGLIGAGFGGGLGFLSAHRRPHGIGAFASVLGGMAAGGTLGAGAGLFHDGLTSTRLSRAQDLPLELNDKMTRLSAEMMSDESRVAALNEGWLKTQKDQDEIDRITKRMNRNTDRYAKILGEWQTNQDVVVPQLKAMGSAGKWHSMLPAWQRMAVEYE